MTDSNNQFPHHLELETSVMNVDLGECRGTETSDDECYEGIAHAGPKAGVSHLEQSNASHHSQNSNGIIDSKLTRGQEAISCDEVEVLTSFSDSNKAGSDAEYDFLDDAQSHNVDEVLVDAIKEYTIQDGNETYVYVGVDGSVSVKDVELLMRQLHMKHYTATSCEGDDILSKCKALIEKDYSCDVIDNGGGTLSEHYPARLHIPTVGKSNTNPDLRSVVPDFNKVEYFRKIEESAQSRLLRRFVAPVILFDGKFICRSGSLSVRKTAAFESARQKTPPQNLEITSSAVEQIGRSLAGSISDLSTRTCRTGYQLLIPSSMEELRADDVAILKNLNVQHICDLMVEDRKIIMQTIAISSSEKINKKTYKDFAIEQMPYPGCEFFARYNEEKHITNGLVFDWKTADGNVEMKFSVEPHEIFPGVNWTEYKEWDLLELTKNYLKMMLYFLVRDSGGMLIHCISGWDRTPLFISLLRMSLWADGLIHQSLNHTEMAYLTLAYDWYLFGHDFPSRLSQKQEILRFCFDILNSISSDEFSATRMYHQLPADQRRGRDIPVYKEGRSNNLIELREFVLGIYDKEIEKSNPN